MKVNIAGQMMLDIGCWINLSLRNSIEQTRSTEVRHEARILEGWLSSFFLVSTSMSDKNVILNINVDDFDSSLYVLEVL